MVVRFISGVSGLLSFAWTSCFAKIIDEISWVQGVIFEFWDIVMRKLFVLLECCWETAWFKDWCLPKMKERENSLVIYIITLIYFNLKSNNYFACTSVIASSRRKLPLPKAGHDLASVQSTASVWWSASHNLTSTKVAFEQPQLQPPRAVLYDEAYLALWFRLSFCLLLLG